MPHVIAGVCFLCLLLVTSWLYVEVKQRFPKLPQGTYIGSVDRLFSDSGEPVKLYVESTPSNELYFVLLRKGWQPQMTTMVSRGGEQSEWLHPVVVTNGEAKLKFTGRADGQGYVGYVFEQEGDRRGTWKLTRVPQKSSETSAAEIKDTEAWVHLKAELAGVEAGIRRAEKIVPQQQREIEQLTAFITEGDNLRRRADEKFREKTRDLQNAQEELRKTQEVARELEKRLILAQSVTRMGNLVSLSRQSLERENRWFDSALNSELPPTGEDFEAAVERAKKIVGVKKAIKEEREYIEHLTSLMNGRPANTPPPPSAPDSFNSIWGGGR